MKNVIVSLLILVMSAASFILLNQAGISSRKELRAYVIAREHFPSYLVKRTVDSYALWKEKRVHGRIVVHLGKYLHFVEPEQPQPTQIPEIVKYHSRLSDLSPTYKDFLWVAMQTNIAREIINVIPQEDFKKRFNLKNDLIAQSDLVTHEYGSPRIFSTRLPAISEPVLLNIDASFFASRTAVQLMNDLMKSGLKADIVTICLAEDNPDVTEFDRQRAREFISLLSAHANIADYNSPKQPARGMK